MEINNWKSVRRKNPNPIKEWPQEVVSKNMGCDRGVSVSRYYIEKFLKDNKKYIKGDVIEIGDNTYTREYGKHNVTCSYIFTADDTTTAVENSQIIHGDLQNGLGCNKNMADCFLLPQTLPFIYDIRNSAKNIIDMLKPGGIALITVSGISMISRYDDSRWGHYWGFTETSLRKLFAEIETIESIEIVSYGNPKVASACLYGLSIKDLKKLDLEIGGGELVPVIIGAKVTKKK
ncbi:MAG: hypothetical protein NC392_00995 [Roseburia sp.]|nr:hypothetical protein [Roseburia sp.]